MVGKYRNRKLVYEEPCTAIEACMLYDGDQTDEERFTKLLKKNEVAITNLNLKPINQQSQDQAPEKEPETNKESLFAENLGCFFFKVTGEDELMDAYELQTVMQTIFNEHLDDGTMFSLETCRCMIAAIDRGEEGTLGFDQFKKLWFTTMDWKQLFEVCDTSKDRTIDKSELTVALHKLGFELNNETVNVITNRYMNRIGTLNFDDFCGICSKLDALKASYDDVKNDKKLTYDKYFMESLFS